MKNLLGFISLLFCFLACSRSDKDLLLTPDGPDGSKNVTALLNDSTWYGRGNASKVIAVAGDACRLNRFNLYVSNELPYPKGARESAPYDCIGPCNTTQHLSFEKVPLAVGKYNMTDLTACSPYPLTGASYGLLIGGDAIFASYTAKGTDSGWIEVTRADTVANVVEGNFELALTSQSAKSVRFRNGRFAVRLQK
ncbi:hypothetical protein IC229_24025 [Spirosoma sp. BT702]|uniref:Uncharacterized protein n=1 Tax=Spirosoma profusum TaxID=2771354 RepID=A0A926Y0N8_9BACT|nr:hypothetical protein [Spirosoma profusum]MBD2703735.1 hypothetical protein [Spirosoma profusum]